MSVGVESIKDVLELTGEILVHLVKGFKDGVDLEDFDFAELYQNNPEFQDAIIQVVGSIKNVPEEIIDVSIFEGVDLTFEVIAMVKKIVSAAKE